MGVLGRNSERCSGVCVQSCLNVVHYYVMKLVNRLRARRIANIERRVARLNVLLSGLDITGDPVIEEEYIRAEAERRRLWLQRSKIVSKLPPIYEGDTTQ